MKIQQIPKYQTIIIVEFAQFGMIGFIAGYITAAFINKHVLIDYDSNNYITKEYKKTRFNRNPLLWVHILWDIAIVVIFTYYCKTIVNYLPSVVSLFQPSHAKFDSRGGEDVVGFTVGVGLIFSRKLDNLNQKLDLLLGDIDDYTDEDAGGDADKDADGDADKDKDA